VCIYFSSYILFLFQIKEGDLIREENETTRNVVMIYKILKENTPINMFEFILNPESYGQSVENLFYVAFLIRDGKACIEDETGEPILCKSRKSECLAFILYNGC